jgi:hypothetical protein
MSAYKKIKCEIVNKNILLQSLECLGFSPTEYKEATKLRGFRGDLRNYTAEIIIPKEQLNKQFTQASNDLGFKWNDLDKKYDLICSDYDMGLKIPERIKQAYAKIAIENAINERKFTIQYITPNKEIQQRKRSKVEIKVSKLV